MNKYHKIILAILFTLAVLLGLAQREQDPYIKDSALNFKSDSETGSALYKYIKSAEDLAQKKQPSIKNDLDFLAVGDIMLSRNVAGTIKKSGDPLLPFSGMKEILNSTDFNFGNLESPISGSNAFNNTGSLVFNAPTTYTTGLYKYNFQVLSLANNHALDQGEKGLFHTLDFLKEKGVKTAGAGKNLEAAWQPAVVEKNGIKICFVAASYSSVNDNGKAVNDFVARIQDIKSLKSSIVNIKSNCDFVVATMHGGTEYITKPNQTQIDFAHAAIDAGADMVIGHHPHWIQTIERYCPNSATISDPPSPFRGEGAGDEGNNPCPTPKLIFYSLGNFIFDQMWSQETREGLALKIKVSKIKNQNELQGPKVAAVLESVELIPVIIDNYSTPRPANAEEAKKVLAKIGETKNILK
ncbi:MAG: CapA family protein [Candidatus Doudnabacteria bacterium]|nr:CapA family protein [Candidatus Doudnabacteria bacterium]